jgi:hypothetical protein
MVEKTMREATDIEGYQAWDKGQRIPKAPSPEMPEPKPPKVENLLPLSKIKLENVVAVPRGKHRIIRNEEGYIFLGFDITVAMKDGTSVSGWMPSKDFHDMRRTLFRSGKVAMNNVEF